jgi:hypothetical protein
MAIPRGNYENVLTPDPGGEPAIFVFEPLTGDPDKFTVRRFGSSTILGEGMDNGSLVYFRVRRADGKFTHYFGSIVENSAERTVIQALYAVRPTQFAISQVPSGVIITIDDGGSVITRPPQVLRVAEEDLGSQADAQSYDSSSGEKKE